ncbi:hypothetical protein ASPZODRAFT_75289 [Penicilliopsis zonata CBS 506.65]|uniref:Small ribosomal subunit protein mS29 n=1 Tax=Penicilliopsis zonata CBS 506.65 TaxID=1073090 RepID=A0A1L9S702_9EURO|nr:hypothetical protein ASPZODRAFT_75289 [Penicilliopsis zonata CBS 506.65]OJJ42932.1 hypothetical protein ASPZODRAFT_75289 [Penicilliopsis zonata CBS 506.65]
MVSPFCWGCLSQLRPATRALTGPAALPQAALFHTSSVRNAIIKKKPIPHDSKGPRYREGSSARMKKKKKPVERARPPAVGERKALRKRIVLSNPNALEVQDMQDLSAETMVDARLRGSVVGLPVPMLDQLRAVQAFKPKQGWSIFRRPGTLMRKETLEMARLFEKIGGDGQVYKKILTGERGSGKSVHLLQAMAMAFTKKWVVITVPEPQELVNAHTGYAPLSDDEPNLYIQNEATAALLSRTITANKDVLSQLHVSQEHPALKKAVQPKMTLQDLAGVGIRDPALAWPVFQALWAELTATEASPAAQQKFKARPPLLVTVDGLAHWMKGSEYRNTEYKVIHAHDLVLVRHFLSLMHPGDKKPTLPNGGLLLYATSASNNPFVYGFDVALDQLAARQAGVSPSSPEFPQPDPWANADQRVLELFRTGKPTSPNERALEIQNIGGVSRTEARGFMEYFARSGLLRENINDEWVSEKWTLASGGVIGELEKLGKRIRVAA